MTQYHVFATMTVVCADRPTYTYIHHHVAHLKYVDGKVKVGNKLMLLQRAARFALEVQKLGKQRWKLVWLVLLEAVPSRHTCHDDDGHAMVRRCATQHWHTAKFCLLMFSKPLEIVSNS